MGTFKDSLKKWFYTTNTAAATTSSRIPLVDSSGNPIGSDTPSNCELKQPLYTGNVFVASYDSNYLRFRQPSQYSSYTSTAVGVGVIEGGKCIIVAKDQVVSTKWATSTQSTAIGTTLGREAAIADMSGRSRTAAIISALGNDAPAATYCNGYYPSNVESSNSYVGAGRWWLPSFGELVMIWSHLVEINRLLSAIGGTPLNTSQWYWSSTEYSASGAWYLTFNSGLFGGSSKTSAYSVRPVSAFY